MTNNYNVYIYKSFINFYYINYLNTNLYYTMLNDNNELNSINENNSYLMIDDRDIDEVKFKLTNYNFIYLNNIEEVSIFELNKNKL